MNMRRRYYSSFFDQLNEYKNAEGNKPQESPNIFSDNLIRLGIFASVLSLAIFGGYLGNVLPKSSESTSLGYFRTDSQPVFNIFKADSSFASEYVDDIEGVQVVSSEDSYVTVDRPKVSYGEEAYLIAFGSGNRIYLKFDLPDVEYGSVFLYVYPASGSTGSLNLSGVANNLWDEELLTFESAPIQGEVISAMPLEQGKPVIFDVTRLVNGRRSVSFALSSPEGQQVTVYSKEFSAYAPRLVLR